MIEFYPQIKGVHIAAVCLSGALFMLRGIATQLNANWPKNALVRYLSYTIDTTILTAAFMLLTILPAAIYANGWLWVKLAFLIAYIVFGIFALQKKRPSNNRLAYFIAACLSFYCMYALARTHHPMGPVIYLQSWLT